MPLSDRDRNLLVEAINAEIAALEDAMIDEPSATMVEGRREDPHALQPRLRPTPSDSLIERMLAVNAT